MLGYYETSGSNRQSRLLLSNIPTYTLTSRQLNNVVA